MSVLCHALLQCGRYTKLSVTLGMPLSHRNLYNLSGNFKCNWICVIVCRPAICAECASRKEIAIIIQTSKTGLFYVWLSKLWLKIAKSFWMIQAHRYSVIIFRISWCFFSVLPLLFFYMALPLNLTCWDFFSFSLPPWIFFNSSVCGYPPWLCGKKCKHFFWMIWIVNFWPFKCKMNVCAWSGEFYDWERTKQLISCTKTHKFIFNIESAKTTPSLS